MKAVIPCAKKKDSLFPFSETKPTALMPVMGRPLVRHLIEGLMDAGVDETYLVVNHLESEFREEFKEDDSVELVVQEDLNGTGGAVEECGFLDDDFLVVNGDVIVSDRDLKRLLDSHRRGGEEVTMLATDDSSPEKWGVLSITNDMVQDLVEKPEEPENTLVNTGIYAFSPEIFDVLEGMEGDKSLTDAVKQLMGEETRFELVQDYWIDIGSPKKLRRADRVLRESIEGNNIHPGAEIHDTAEILGDVVVEEGAVLKPGAVVEGPAYIGKDSRIGPHASVRSSTVCGDSELDSCTVRNSLLFENNIIDPHTHVEHTVLGEGCDLKSGSVVRNSFIGADSFIDMNNSIRGMKFVPDARTDLSEISK
ncbi:MAG: sugar phosphate nucleotidyltransferase [Candidatus Nanohaloarchaea archaeon]